jgi:hypothetical protein
MEVSTKQLQIAELAATRPEESFTSLNHYLDMDWMKEAYRRTRRESAPGVDGQTMEEYGKELESNLQELIGLAKSGRYQAPPVRRVHIPKGDGKETRPIGIPTCQDKFESPIGCTEILQRLPVLRHPKLIDRAFSRRKGYSPFLKASHLSNLMLSRYRVTSAACAVYRSRARLFVVAGRSFAYWS